MTILVAKSSVIYLNSTEYGITLSEDIGPNMKQVTDDVYQATLPSPRDSEFLKKFLGFDSPPSDFRDK
jgi:hypothetical protein